MVNAIEEIESKYEGIVSELNEAKETVSEQKELIEQQEVKVNSLESSIKEYEQKEVEAKKQNAINRVKADIEAGKFKEDQKEELEKVAIKDINAYETLANAVNVNTIVKGVDIVSELKAESESFEKIASEYGLKAEEFTYDNLDKNHPEVLKNIENKNGKVFKALEQIYIDQNS